MNRVETVAGELAAAFERILNERMAGIPILNERLRVEAVDFQLYEGRPFGVIITPWLMNLVMLPAEDDDWSQMKTGEVQTYQFISGVREFQVNEIEDAGIVHSHSLYSPMFRFVNQDHARAAARHCLAELMTKPDSEQHLDEERLKQFIEGGAMPPDETGLTGDGDAGAEAKGQAPKPAVKLARSDLLRGNFSGKS